MLAVFQFIGSVGGFIFKALAIGAALFFLGCLLATQIMDVYYGLTGETWEARCKRLRTKDQEGQGNE